VTDEDNKAIVQQVYAAFRRRDLHAILALQADDAEWSVAASRDLIPWATPGTGHEGVKKFLRVLGESLIAEVFEIRTYLADGDKVVALGYQKGMARPTERAYEFDFVHVWTLASGRVKSFRVYYDTAYVGGILRK
jgi:ketosteroid isomerase-like protein